MDIRSPFNLGAIIRSAEFFGFKNLILCDCQIDLDSPRLLKTARGCLDNLKIEIFSDQDELWQNYVIERAYQAWAFETTSSAQPLDQVPISTDDKALLIFGNEEYGVKKDLLLRAQRVIKLEALGQKNSLNISAMAAVVFYHFSRPWRQS